MRITSSYDFSSVASMMIFKEYNLLSCMKIFTEFNCYADGDVFTQLCILMSEVLGLVL